MNIYYSVQNGGDGSAYPMFLTTSKLADWDQEHMDEGWGEPCTGKLSVRHGGFAEDRIVCPDAMDAVSYWLQRTEDEDYELWDLRQQFLDKFFPNGLPKFEVLIRKGSTYYDIYVDGVKKGARFGYSHETKQAEVTEAGRVALEEQLNRGGTQ